mmetsp:Transcript_37679/g.88121  ORF Transcript_37679/g.88121 Transcript_37679/m.88121 type:complete len:242 (-) Transcript_37679:819-1544(-)
MAKHLDELRAELVRSVSLGRLQRADERQHVRVATCEALPDDLERAGHDVGALDCDGHRHRHVHVAHKIHVAPTDARAAEDVHAILDHAPPALGARLLHDGREHHGRLVVVDNGVHQLDAGNHRVRLTASTCERLLDAAEFGDGHAELLADARVGTDGAGDGSRSAHRAGGERDAATLSEGLDEHVPAEAAALLAAKDRGHRDPHVLAFDRAVHESGIERHVPRAHPKALMTPLEQGDGEAL